MRRSFSSLYVLAASAFVLLLVAAPAAADAPGSTDAPAGTKACQQTAATVAGGITVQAEAQGSGGEISGPGAQADCYARCKDGSYLKCSGSTCNATDTDCSTNTSGSCYGSGTGWKYCNDTCGPVCAAWASCASAGGGSVSCESYGANDCYAIDNCYAYCDGTYHMCPSPPGPCPF